MFLNPWNIKAAIESYVTAKQVEAQDKRLIVATQLKGEAAYRKKRLSTLQEELRKLKEESK